MSIQVDFTTLVAQIFGRRLYPGVAPDSPAPPYATYFRVVATEQPTLDSNGGTGNLINTRLQLDVYALGYLEATAKAGEVKAALKGWHLENVVLLERETYEADTKLHRVMLDISTWHY